MAKREITVRDDGERRVEIRIFSPETGPDGGCRCRYEIDWPHGITRSEGWGVDAVQAIHLTLQKIGVDLYFSEYHKAGQLVWRTPGEGYGFPVPRNARDLLVRGMRGSRGEGCLGSSVGLDEGA